MHMPEKNSTQILTSTELCKIYTWLTGINNWRDLALMLHAKMCADCQFKKHEDYKMCESCPQALKIKELSDNETKATT